MANWGEVGTFRVGIEVTGGTAGAKKIVYASSAININNSGLIVADTGVVTICTPANSDNTHTIWGNKLAISRSSTATIGLGNSSDLGFVVVNGTGNTDAGFFRVYQQTLDGSTKNFISIGTDKDGAVTWGPTDNSQIHDIRSPTGTAGAVSTYLKIKVGGTEYRIPLHATA